MSPFTKMSPSEEFFTLMMTHCQYYILTEIIWFVWSETSYTGDIAEMSPMQACRTNKRKTTRENRTTKAK